MDLEHFCDDTKWWCDICGTKFSWYTEGTSGLRSYYSDEAKMKHEEIFGVFGFFKPVPNQPMPD